MFLPMRHVNDLLDHVKDKKEIHFRERDGVTIAVYAFSDATTFDVPQALECRGAAFDSAGNLISRPLHKFFNMGEKPHTQEHVIRQRKLAGVFEKLDGSMIATAWLNGQLLFRSKGSFGSDVVNLTYEMVNNGFEHVGEFSTRCARNGLTAIFELTHPKARIVVDPGAPNLRLLHVRDNLTGQYVLLDSAHVVHEWIAEHGIELVPRFAMSMDEALESLESMENQEGYIFQFDDGDMVKVKCPWYLRLHRSVTFLRERDIAVAALHEELDDIKGHLRLINADLGPVEEVEARLKSILVGYSEEIEERYQEHKHLDRKSYAVALKGHPLFGFLMGRFENREDLGLKKWYEQKKLRDDFSLRVLADGALGDELRGNAPETLSKSPKP